MQARACVRVKMLSYILGVKIYIDTHRLNELCDTEGANKYPLGTLGTPNATP